MPRRSRLLPLLAFAAVAGSAVFVLLQVQPSLLITNTTPAGGDMGAHVWGPAYLRDELIPRLRLTGWTPDWYAGFPAYHFYFPLPSLAIVALDLLLPYGVAFKLVTVSGVVAMPVAAWAMGRLGRLPFPAPPLLAVATVPFLFDRFHTIWGGNVPSTLAGEFSFSIALTLALLFLGVFARSLDTGSHRALAAGLLAATALSHLLPTAFAIAGAAALLLSRRPDRRRWLLAATVAAVAFLVSAVWVVPFLARLGFSNDMGWERTNTYLEHLFPFLRDATDAAPAITRHFYAVVPLAFIGAVATIVRRRRFGVALVATAVVMATAFRFLPDGAIWNARLLPFWYLLLYFLAALAVAEIAILVSEAVRGPEGEGERVPLAVGVAVSALTVLLVVGAPLGALPRWLPLETADRSFIPDWARWNYSGYQRKAAWPEYSEIVQTMDDVGADHGCGRAFWEYEPQLDRYGTPMALMLLPYWTGGCIGSMEGLYFESSATVPYHFLLQSELSQTPSRAMRDLPYRALDLDAGVAHMQLLGVRYYLALSPEAQRQAAVHPDLTLLTTTTSYEVNYPDGTKPRHWEIYQVAGAPLVEPLRHEPVVVDDLATDLLGRGGDKEAWLHAAVAWFQDESAWAVPVAAGGPAAWPRADEPGATPPLPGEPLPAVSVSGIEAGESSISFEVSRPGVPVLVKTSYFPNWKASGADGPWRVTPNFMVVVPTSENVELRYGWTPVDLTAWALTLIGLAALVVLARRPPVALPQPAPKAEPYVDPFAVAAAPITDPDPRLAANNGTEPAAPLVARPDEERAGARPDPDG